MFLFQSCKTSLQLLGQSIGQQALLPGISDVIIVQYPNGLFKSTPFLVCFGPSSILHRTTQIMITTNHTTTIHTSSTPNIHGYLHTLSLNQQQILLMNLKYGHNTITYSLNQNVKLSSSVYLLKITDKLLISDFDGTLTISDFGGLWGGMVGKNCVQKGYPQLIKKLYDNNIIIVWVTMRSLPFYQFTKKYTKTYIPNIDGILLMQPQQFLPAVKKQLFKKTGNIKANLIKKISQLFPSQVSPFVGGLGNRQNDAIAYMNIGIKLKNIYLVSTKNMVQRMSNKQYGLNYEKMAENVEEYFQIK